MSEASALTFIIAFLLSAAATLYLTPIMRRAALELGIVDRPDGKLKTQKAPTPYLGGVAVYLAFLMTVGVLTDFGQETLGYLLSGSIVIMVGLIDDLGVLTPRQKLAGQTVAALVLIKSGTYIKLGFLPFWVAVPLTILWILTVTNAMNIIDVMDGLATGVAAIAALMMAWANIMAGRPHVAFLCFALAGAAIGFLRYNFHPAQIYLGDTGSLFIGFMLAVLSLNAGYTRFNLLAVISPVLILGIPLFDLALVMWLRWRRGMPIMKGSPDHFALRLRRCKLTVKETAVTTYIVALLLGGVAILMSQVGLELAFATITGTVVVMGLSAYLLAKVDMTS